MRGRSHRQAAPAPLRQLASVEVVFSSSRTQAIDLKENGFAWCKENKVLIRLLIDASITTTVAIF